MTMEKAADVTEQTIPVEGGELPLTVARAGGGGAAVVILPSAFGIAPDVIAQMGDLAHDASLVVALNPFFREGGQVIPYDDLSSVMTRLGGLDFKRAYRDLRATIDWVRRAKPPSVVMVGVCFGGAYSFFAAADGAVDGVVTWHGTRMDQYLSRAADIRCPLRLHFGEIDPVTPRASVESIRTAFEGRNEVKVFVHQGATHGFSHRTAVAYDARAEQAGMASVRELVRALG